MATRHKGALIDFDISFDPADAPIKLAKGFDRVNYELLNSGKGWKKNVWEPVVRAIRKVMRLRFKTMTDPHGKSWAPLQTKYVRWKQAQVAGGSMKQVGALRKKKLVRYTQIGKLTGAMARASEAFSPGGGWETVYIPPYSIRDSL